MKAPRKPVWHKYVVTFSVEVPGCLTKTHVKHLVREAVKERMFYITGNPGKVRVRTVDFD